MILADQIKDLEQRSGALERCLNIEQKRIDLLNEEEKTQVPDFWDNPDQAREQLRRVAAIKAWVDDYDAVAKDVEDLALMPEFVKEGVVSEQEMDAHYAQTLELIISRVGAVIVLLAALAMELITSLNMTVSGIITAIKNRPRIEYDEPKREHPDPAERIVNHVATRHIEHVQQEQERRRAKASEFDLPVDEPPLPVQEAKPRKELISVQLMVLFFNI